MAIFDQSARRACVQCFLRHLNVLCLLCTRTGHVLVWEWANSTRNKIRRLSFQATADVLPLLRVECRIPGGRRFIYKAPNTCVGLGLLTQDYRFVSNSGGMLMDAGVDVGGCDLLRLIVEDANTKLTLKNVELFRENCPVGQWSSGSDCEECTACLVECASFGSGKIKTGCFGANSGLLFAVALLDRRFYHHQQPLRP